MGRPKIICWLSFLLGGGLLPPPPLNTPLGTMSLFGIIFPISLFITNKFVEVKRCQTTLNTLLWGDLSRVFSHTGSLLVAVGKKNVGDRQRNAEVDRQPWVCLVTGVRAAEVPHSFLATTIDGIAGRVTAKLVHHHADLSGRHVGRHVTHFVCVS